MYYGTLYLKKRTQKRALDLESYPHEAQSPRHKRTFLLKTLLLSFGLGMTMRGRSAVAPSSIAEELKKQAFQQF